MYVYLRNTYNFIIFDKNIREIVKYEYNRITKNIYKILDRVIETGIPVHIERKGIRLKIIIEEPIDKLNNIKKRKGLNVDPDEIVDIKWEQEWKPSI